MPSIGHAGLSGLEALWGATAAQRRQVVRWVGLIGAAASLAACAQSSVVSRHTAFAPPSTRQAAFERARETHVSVVRRQVTPSEHHVATATPAAGGAKGGGLASFYTEGNSTASGEKYDPNELTAAHPSLPFGTKLRVTNTTTGKSVTVRVNDRGPYVPGRVVDVSYSAAQALGMVHSGTANVKLDVVQ
jgi:rare lipoprotein A